MGYPPGVAQDGEKLWGYASLARLWSWTLIAVAGLLLLLSIALQAGSDEGLDSWWWAAALGITGITGVISYPLFRVWLRKTALPSVRLPQAASIPTTTPSAVPPRPSTPIRNVSIAAPPTNMTAPVTSAQRRQSRGVASSRRGPPGR